MTKTNLIKDINTLLESIEDLDKLEAIYELIEYYRNTKDTRTWNHLTQEQKSHILIAFEESENDENLIPMNEVFKG